MDRGFSVTAMLVASATSYDTLAQRLSATTTETLAMGDKSPKAKQREKNQKDAAKAQSKNDQARRQASYAAGNGKEKKK